MDKYDAKHLIHQLDEMAGTLDEVADKKLRETLYAAKGELTKKLSSELVVEYLDRGY